MSSLSTHILDTSLGKPAAGVEITLSAIGPGGKIDIITEAKTDSDGRVGALLPEGQLQQGIYQLRFEVASYFVTSGRESFFPAVEITFTVQDPTQHYHVPLLLSPYGYSTYRGS